jgi:hypothetical protein
MQYSAVATYESPVHELETVRVEGASNLPDLMFGMAQASIALNYQVDMWTVISPKITWQIIPQLDRGEPPTGGFGDPEPIVNN